LLDLFHQRRACRVTREHLDAALLGERGVDVVERILHRRGGKDDDRFFLRCRPMRHRDGGGSQGGEEANESKHDDSPKGSYPPPTRAAAPTKKHPTASGNRRSGLKRRALGAPPSYPHNSNARRRGRSARPTASGPCVAAHWRGMLS